LFGPIAESKCDEFTARPAESARAGRSLGPILPHRRTARAASSSTVNPCASRNASVQLLLRTYCEQFERAPPRGGRRHGHFTNLGSWPFWGCQRYGKSRPVVCLRRVGGAWMIPEIKTGHCQIRNGPTEAARSISNPTIATTQLLISSDRSITAGADHLPWLPLSKAARNDSLSSVRAAIRSIVREN
jgi:hypothetical protein